MKVQGGKIKEGEGKNASKIGLMFIDLNYAKRSF